MTVHRIKCDNLHVVPDTHLPNGKQIQGQGQSINDIIYFVNLFPIILLL